MKTPYSQKIKQRQEQGLISTNDIFIFVASETTAFDYANNHFTRLHDVLVLTLKMEPMQYNWEVVKNRGVLVFDLTKEGYPIPLTKIVALILLKAKATVIRWIGHDGLMTKFTQR